MPKLTFITWNPKKAEYLSRYLSFPVEHKKLDLDEIQSTDLRKIVEHKVWEAFALVGSPVLVEDVSLVFESFGGLPGPFIKFFIEEIGLEKLCKMIPGEKRDAIARCIFGYYDGVEMQFFKWEIRGTIAQAPRGNGWFGWDKIFIPYFSEKTAAELDEEEYQRFYTEEKPFQKIQEYFS